MPDAAAEASSVAIACSARPTREWTRFVASSKRDRDDRPDDGCVQRAAQVVPDDGERLRHRDAVLTAREPVPRVEQAEKAMRCSASVANAR